MELRIVSIENTTINVMLIASKVISESFSKAIILTSSANNV